MADFNGIKILEILDKIFRKNYNKKSILENVGLSSSGSNCIINYKDGDLEIRVKVSHKTALKMYFDNQKSNGQFKNIDYEKFEEKYNEGVELDKIEEEIKKEQLPLE